MSRRFRKHSSDQFAGHCHAIALHETDVFDYHVAAAYGKTAQTLCPAGNDQGVITCKKKRKGRATASVTLGVLIMIGRPERAYRLAHQREIPGQWADGQDKWLCRMVPGLIRLTISAEKKSGKAAAAGDLGTFIDDFGPALAGGEIDNQNIEAISHRTNSLSADP